MGYIDGELKNAQLEQSAGDPAVASRGRIYIDISAPLLGLPKIYDGTSWKTLAFTTASTIVAVNSGKSVVIDWSAGRKQVVTLTDNATIGFTNAVEGEEHELIVRQTSTRVAGASVLFVYKFNMIDQENTQDFYQPQRILIAGSVRVHKWLYRAGIVPAYATIPSVTYTPLTVPLAAVSGMSLHPVGDFLVITGATTPFNTYYALDQLAPVPMNNPFGARNVSTPTTLAGASLGSVFHPSGKAIYFAGGTTPFIQGMGFYNGAPGAALANPGTLPTGAAKCIDITSDGNLIAVGHTTTPFMSAYPVTTAAFGTKLTNPATLPAAQVNALAFSPGGDFLTVGSATTPFIQTYPLVQTTTAYTFGAQVANPGTLPNTGSPVVGGKSIAWRPQGDFIAFGMDASPGLYVVPFNRTTGAYGVPLTITTSPGAAVNAVQWSPCGSYLIAVGASPGLWVYDFSSLTLGVPLAFDGASPSAAVQDVVVHQSGKYFILGMGTASMQAWAMPTRLKNYLRIWE